MALVLALALAGCGPPTAGDGVAVLADGWQYRWGDSPRDPAGALTWSKAGEHDAGWKPITLPDKVPGRDGERFLWMRTRLPSQLPPHAAVFVRYVDQSVEMYVDGVPVHRFGDLSAEKPQAATGRPFHLVPLPTGSAGGMLSLRIYSEHTQIGPMGNVYLGSEPQVLAFIRRTGAGQFLLGLVAFTVGLCSLVLLAFDRRNRRVPFLAGLSLCTGIYAIATPFSPLKQLFHDAPSLWLHLELASLYLVPTCYFGFYETMAEGAVRRITRVLWLSFFAFDVLAIAGSLLGVFTLLATLQPFHILVSAAMVFGLATTARSARKGGIDVRIFLAGLTLAALAGLRDMFVDERMVPREDYWTPIGLFIWVLGMGWFEVRSYSRMIRERATYLAETELRNRELVEARANIADAAARIGHEAASLLGAARRQLELSNSQAAANHQATAAASEIAQASSVAAVDADHVIETAKKSEALYSDGRQMVEQAISGVEQLSQQVQSIAESITGLAERNARIGDITVAMKELSERSNLLALNAQIEARRAGEHGQGFAVVAREMRKLAEESKDATVRVRRLLQEVLGDTRQAVQKTEQGRKSVDAVVERARGAGWAISGLAGVIGESTSAVQKIATAAREQATGVQQIVTAMSDSSSAVEEALAGTRTIEETSRGLSELASRLARLAGSGPEQR